MNGRSRVDGPEKKKLEGAKAHKAVILATEKRINDLKKAIKETKFEFVKEQCKEELKLMEDWLAKYKIDPNIAPFDEFTPLYETSSK